MNTHALLYKFNNKLNYSSNVLIVIECTIIEFFYMVISKILRSKDITQRDSYIPLLAAVSKSM